MAEIRLENLGKTFGRNVVIDDISLTIAEGEFCVFVGPSGCGKSTLLRLIAGLEEASSGRILIGGRDVTQPNLMTGTCRWSFKVMRFILT